MTRTSIMPCLVYRDAPAAIDWLCQAFGFAQHLVVPGDGGRGYTLADPEGYVWHFGSYDPWQDSELNPP